MRGRGSPRRLRQPRSPSRWRPPQQWPGGALQGHFWRAGPVGARCPANGSLIAISKYVVPYTIDSVQTADQTIGSGRTARPSDGATWTAIQHGPTLFALWWSLTIPAQDCDAPGQGIEAHGSRSETTKKKLPDDLCSGDDCTVACQVKDEENGVVLHSGCPSIPGPVMPRQLERAEDSTGQSLAL